MWGVWGVWDSAVPLSALPLLLPLLQARVGLPFHHDSHSNAPVCWRHCRYARVCVCMFLGGAVVTFTMVLSFHHRDWTCVILNAVTPLCSHRGVSGGGCLLPCKQSPPCRYSQCNALPPCAGASVQCVADQTPLAGVRGQPG